MTGSPTVAVTWPVWGSLSTACTSGNTSANRALLPWQFGQQYCEVSNLHAPPGARMPRRASGDALEEGGTAVDEQAAASEPMRPSPEATVPDAGVEAAPDGAPAPQSRSAEDPEAPVRPADVCQRFGLSPYVLRALLDEYGDWLPQADGGLTPAAVERLGAIVRWRADGVSSDAIRTRLDAGQRPEEPLAALFGRMADLHAALSRSEEHRVQDRDRLMMALIRTQQEIHQLRHEMSDRPSRRDRHRGFWRRLFAR